MTKKAKKTPFDPNVFLATVNGGRSISNYRMNQKVFAQGNSADAVFYIQKGIKVWLSYNSAEYLGKVIYARHGLADPPSTPKLAEGLKEFADYATK